MKFIGTKDYISTEDLSVAVNASITLEKPLLVKGEPGTGKTELARQIANSLKLKIIEWNIKSTTKAQQGLYEYDAVSRLRDSQLKDKKINNISNYIKNNAINMNTIVKTDSYSSALSIVQDGMAIAILDDNSLLKANPNKVKISKILDRNFKYRISAIKKDIVRSECNEFFNFLCEDAL